MIGNVALNVNFALSEPRLAQQPYWSALWRNLTNTLFSSQWLEWNMKILT